MVVRKGSICVCSDHYIFCYSGCIQRAPFDSSARANFLHVLVQAEALLLGEKIENLDRSVTAAGCNVLVVVVKSEAESRGRNIAESILMGDFLLTRFIIFKERIR